VALSPELAGVWARAEDEHHRAWREGRVAFDEHRRRRLRTFLPAAGLPVGNDAALDEQFRTGYLPAYRRQWRGYDDVAAGLAAIRDAGLRTALLTNGMQEQQHAKLAALGLTGRVGPVLTAEGLGVAKPRAEAFAAACDAVGAPAAAVLHLGDDHPVDVVGARAAGLRAVHLDRAGTGPAGETERLTSLHELAGYLEGTSG